MYFYIKLTVKSRRELLRRSSSSFFALFLVVVEKYCQAQTSNFSHIFVIRIEPEPSYKIAHKWCF